MAIKNLDEWYLEIAEVIRTVDRPGAPSFQFPVSHFGRSRLGADDVLIRRKIPCLKLIKAHRVFR